MKLWVRNVLLIVVAVLIAAAPLLFLKDAEFAGADGLAGDAITEIAPEYQPWFEPLLELPSGEIESLMFALQAAIGAGIVGFVLGRLTSKRKDTIETIEESKTKTTEDKVS